MKSSIIEVIVMGATQTGKSAILAEIKQHLESKNMAVIYSDREQRNNEPAPFDDSAPHEMPNLDKTVAVLSEQNYRR